MGKFRIAAAGNAEIPAYLTLRQKGYGVRREKRAVGREFWYAAKDEREFIAGGPIELLGIVSLYESRGENWIATDEEIDAFMTRVRELTIGPPIYIRVGPSQR